MMRKPRLLLLAAVPAALLGGLVVWGASLALVAGAVSVQKVTPHAADMVAANQSIFKDDPPEKNSADYPKKVLEIYGIPAGEPELLLFVDPKALTRPPEMPSLAFLLVGQDGGGNPWQAKTVAFWGTLLLKASVVAAAALLLANLLVWSASPAPGGRHAAAH
jgi:hypothetical protein